jgi:glycosyltransferase involved in cell wall biosynthesis
VTTDRRLHVAIVLYSAKATGARRQKIRLANAFARRGCRVDLVFVRARGALIESVSPEVRIVELCGSAIRVAVALRWGSLGVTAAALPSLVSHLRRSRPDVVMGGNSPISYLTSLAHRIAGVKQIRSVLCMTNHLSGSEVTGAAAEMRLARWVLPWADAVVPVGDAVAKDLAENVPGIEKELRTIHNPVVTDDLAERCAADPPYRWFEDGGPPIVIGCGRLEPQKDFATLLRAFALVLEEIDARLVIAGGGPERRSLEALAASLGIDASTAFLGRIDDPFAAMARSGVLVLSSRWEGMPNVVIEALACGCPVVATDAPGGSREALLDGELGPLVPRGDPRAMADAIVQVLREPPSRSALEARGAQFTEGKSVDTYLALFRSLTSEGEEAGLGSA